MFNSLNSVNIKKDEYCYAMITIFENFIICTVVNAQTEKIILDETIDLDDNFIKKIYFNNKIYKAIIVNELEINSRKFCVDLKEKLNKMKIPNYFNPRENFVHVGLLAAAKLNIKFDETVLINMVDPEKIFVTECKFTPSGYEKIRRTTIKLEAKNDNFKIREQILQSSKPKKIIVNQDHASVLMKSIFDSKKLVILNKNFFDYRDRLIVETCKWLLDKSYTRYHILPKYFKASFVVIGRCHVGDAKYTDGKSIILTAEPNSNLPWTQSAIFQRSVPECGMLISHGQEKYEYHKVEFKRNCHRLKIILNIDTESFETYNIEQIFIKKVVALPKKLDTVMKTKIPVIGFFDNISVVCINKNGSYQFSDGCGGSLGMDNSISFDEKKPKYGEPAMKMMKAKPSYVVFGLLKILSMPEDKIKISVTWGFKITCNAENAILIEYDDFNNPGKRTAASPAFLMALLIKKHYFKAIKTELGGESPKEIGIWIYDQFDEDEMKRIKEGFEEACKLIKVKCIFVDS